MCGVNVKKGLILFLCFLLLVTCAPLAKAEAEEAAVYTTTSTYIVQNTGSNQALNVRVLIYLFDDVSGWGNQEVLSESITVDGEPISPEIFRTEDNRWTRISLDNFEPGQTKVIEVVQVLKVGVIDFDIDPEGVGTDIPQDALIYTRPVDGLWQSDNPTIQSVAQQFTEGATNLYSKTRQIFDQILEQPDGETLLSYQIQNQEHDALWALQSKMGDCTEFSNLMVALLRATGIPAKVVSGYAFLPLYSPTGSTGDIGQLAHAYVICYLPNYGWVPLDAVWPRYTGSFGSTDYAHIAGASIVGEGSVKNDGIKWLSPGYISTNWQYFTGQATNVDGNAGPGAIEAEILVSSTLSNPSTINDGLMTITLTTKNMGKSDATNLVAELDLDDGMFEVVSQSQEKSGLGSQEEWVTSFDVRVKEPAYGTTQELKAKVAFDSADGEISGTFLSTGSLTVAIPAVTTSPPPVTTPAGDFTMYIIIGVIAAVAIIAVVALKRR